MSASKIHWQTAAMWVCFSCSSIAFQPDLKEPPSFRMRSYIDYNNSKMDIVSRSQQLCPNKEVLWPWLPCLHRKTTSQGNFPSDSLGIQPWSQCLKLRADAWWSGREKGDHEERTWALVLLGILSVSVSEHRGALPYPKLAARLLCAALQEEMRGIKMVSLLDNHYR